MSVSLSTLERGNPPPRRKSCAACTKTKRRCDLGAPACARCSQRGLACAYPAGAPSRRRAERLETRHTSHALEVVPDSSVSQMPSSMTLWTGPGLGDILPSRLGVDVGGANVPGLSFGDANCFLPDIAESEAMFGGILPPGTDWDILDFDLPPLGLVPTTPLRSSPRPIILSPKRAGEKDAVAEIIATRLQYSIDHLLAAPRQMVTDSQTPWCHPQLWRDGMPRCMEDALSSCALYMAKNTTNTPVILRTVENRVHDLLALIAKPPPTDAGSNVGLELLARAQALLLYQILRLFDGDPRAREAAEETATALQDASAAVLAHITAPAATCASSSSDGEEDGLSWPLSSTDTCAYYPSHPAACSCSRLETLSSAASFPFTDSSTDEYVRDVIPLLTTYNSHQYAFAAFLPEVHTTLSPSPPTPAPTTADTFWRTWVFAESARRTIMAAFFLTAAYRLVRGPPSSSTSRAGADTPTPTSCDGRLGLGRHAALTLSAHLWRAGCAAEFAAAWRGQAHFVVMGADFREAIGGALPSDLEVFGKMLLTTIMGIDEVKRWMSSLGGTL